MFRENIKREAKDNRGVGRMKREFELGEVYRPRVHILKIKNDRPTVIKVSGREYTLRHKDQFRGRKGQKQIRGNRRK